MISKTYTGFHGYQPSYYWNSPYPDYYTSALATATALNQSIPFNALIGSGGVYIMYVNPDGTIGEADTSNWPPVGTSGDSSWRAPSRDVWFGQITPMVQAINPYYLTTVQATQHAIANAEANANAPVAQPSTGSGSSSNNPQLSGAGMSTAAATGTPDVGGSVGGSSGPNLGGDFLTGLQADFSPSQWGTILGSGNLTEILGLLALPALLFAFTMFSKKGR